MQIYLNLITLAIITATVNSCGMLTHHEITKQALHFYNDSTISPILRDYQSFLQAGTFFPDWGYACGSQNGSETAHWQPFWKAGIQLLNRKYSKPYSDEAKGLIAFMFGVIGHGVSDVLWHSLGLEQGFIDAMKHTDFDDNYPSAHSNADFGGDMAISRFTSLTHLQGWSIPFNDVLEIYESMSRPVTFTQLRACTLAAYGLQQLEMGLGKYIFPRFAYRSPFLVDNLFSYFRGGINFMATSTLQCWNEATNWITSGVVNSSCVAMTYSSEPKSQPPSTLCSRIHANLLRTSNNPSILHITSTTASWLTNQICILATVNSQPRSFPILVSSSVTAIYNRFISLFSSDPCDTGDIILTGEKYSRFGSEMVKGDFDHTGNDQIVIAAPQYDTVGRVFISNLMDSFSTVLKGPGEPGGGFGSGMAVIDWNRDGIDDLAISAPGLGVSNGLYQDGGIFIYLGSERGLNTQAIFINGSVERTVQEDIVDDRLHYYGESLFSADIDGDGFKDLIVLSPHDTPILSGYQRGSVQCFLSSNKNRDEKLVLTYFDADWTLTGNSDYELFGNSITVVNKAILIGAPGYTIPGSYSLGAVYGYDSSNPSLPQFQFRWLGSEDFGSFGYHINSNPKGEILISSPFAQTPAPTPNFMDLPGLIVPGHANGYQGGVVRIRSGVDLTFGDYSNEVVLNGSRSMSHFGKRSVYYNGSWIMSEPTVEGERGRVFGKKCWKGRSYHERFGTNLMVFGDKLLVYSETEYGTVSAIDV